MCLQANFLHHDRKHTADNSYIKVLLKNIEVVLLGYFNLPSLHWDRRNVIKRTVSEVDVDFFKMLLNRGLAEPINVSTILLSCILIDMCLCLHADLTGFCEFKVPFPNFNNVVMLSL